jgi:hypothetical protein
MKINTFISFIITLEIIFILSNISIEVIEEMEGGEKEAGPKYITLVGQTFPPPLTSSPILPSSYWSDFPPTLSLCCRSLVRWLSQPVTIGCGGGGEGDLTVAFMRGRGGGGGGSMALAFNKYLCTQFM